MLLRLSIVKIIFQAPLSPSGPIPPPPFPPQSNFENNWNVSVPTLHREGEGGGIWNVFIL